ncbi:hypothetical protein Hanom_Chr14g01275041 [Helianthus anomalus]
MLGLECLTGLYEESCGLNKMLEIELRKAETTIIDQGMIVVAKSQHYEDKFKAMTQEAKAAINKANEDAQAKLDATHLQFEQDMTTYREALGFECPSWIVSAWEAKLKDLGGSRVEYPAKLAGEEPSKAANETTDAEKNPDGDDCADAGGNVVGEEGAAP